MKQSDAINTIANLSVHERLKNPEANCKTKEREHYFMKSRACYDKVCLRIVKEQLSA